MSEKSSRKVKTEGEENSQEKNASVGAERFKSIMSAIGRFLCKAGKKLGSLLWRGTKAGARGIKKASITGAHRMKQAISDAKAEREEERRYDEQMALESGEERPLRFAQHIYMRIALPTAACFAVTFIIAILCVNNGLSGLYSTTVKSRLTEIASSAAEKAALTAGSAVGEYDKQIKDIAERASDDSQSIITIIADPSGNIVGYPGQYKENKAYKELIVKAMKSGTGSESLKILKEKYLAGYAAATSSIDGTTWYALSLQTEKKALSLVDSVRSNFTVVAILALCISSAILAQKTKKIVSPIRPLIDASKSIAAGSEAALGDMHYNNEFDGLIFAFRRMNEANRAMAETADRIADGDFSVNVAPRSENDMLGNAMRKLVSTNRRVLSTVSDVAGQMNSGAEEVARASQNIAQGAATQAGAVEAVSEDINHMEQNIGVNARNASEARERVDDILSDLGESKALMENMSQAMKDIYESSQKISEINKLIDGIASQTNILSLNAAVEAARAGTHGQGFAVVAEEVRNLAAQSGAAASQTADLIKDALIRVEKGNKYTTEAMAALTSINTKVDECASLIGTIATASDEQSQAITRIGKSMTDVSAVVQNNSATSEECAASSEQLSAQATSLLGQLKRFTLR